MNEVKHTRGPWKINKHSWPMSIEGNIHQITNDELFPSAFVPAWDNPQHGEIDGSEEALANACLISAAPEMLEALEKAKETIRVWHGPTAWDIYDRSSPEMQVINHAIAKAKGLAP